MLNDPKKNESGISESGISNPALGALPSGIWALGMVSLFMDISSELVHSLLPIFMTTVLGVSMVTVGLVEGIAESTALITKLFSGGLSDYFRKRKILLMIGYGLGAITKPVFPLATSIGWVFAGRFVDRIGKGIRGAPRDALVADITPPAMRGKAYGLRQSLDSVGAFLGPLFAIILMLVFSNQLKAVFWVAVIPAIIAFFWLILAVREPQQPAVTSSKRVTLTFARASNLDLRFWVIVVVGAVFTLARFSEAFLILRAQSVGLTIGYIPLVMVFMNVVYSAAAYPAGIAADRLHSRTLLVAGLAVLIGADLVLATANSAWQVFGGAAMWGLHMALTQGLLSKLVADTAPNDLRGTAFGIYNLVSGVSLLVASVVAGFLWDSFGPPMTFVVGAIFAAIAAIGLLAIRPKSSAV